VAIGMHFRFAPTSVARVWYSDPDRDVISGSEGDDTLIGNQDIDRLYGDSGRDTFKADLVVTATGSINAATNPAAPNPIVVTSTTPIAAILANGNVVQIAGIVGNTSANGVWTVADVNTALNTFSLKDSLGNYAQGNGNYAGGGSWEKLGPVGPEPRDYDSATDNTVIHVIASESVGQFKPGKIDFAVAIPDPGLRLALAEAIGIARLGAITAASRVSLTKPINASICTSGTTICGLPASVVWIFPTMSR